jgi:hypothetical protein
VTSAYFFGIRVLDIYAFSGHDPVRFSQKKAGKAPHAPPRAGVKPAPTMDEPASEAEPASIVGAGFTPALVGFGLIGRDQSRPYEYDDVIDVQASLATSSGSTWVSFTVSSPG